MVTDAAQHMAGKKYFCKLDCSQAYHCIPMADEQSIQLLYDVAKVDAVECEMINKQQYERLLV